jgi:hypothetical protein
MTMSEPDLRRRWPAGVRRMSREALVRTLEGHTSFVMGVGVTPDGRRAVSAGDHTLRVWDLDTGACVRTLDRHTDDVTSASVATDGRRAVSGSSDRTLRVWDMANGNCLAVEHVGYEVQAVACGFNTIGAGCSSGPVMFFSLEHASPGPRVVTAFEGLNTPDAQAATLGFVVGHEDAERQLRSEYRICLERLGESHHNTLRTRLGLAAELERTERLTDALEIYRDSAQSWVNMDDAAPMAAIEPMERLAACLEQAGDAELAHSLEARVTSMKARDARERSRLTRSALAMGSYWGGDLDGAEQDLRVLLAEGFRVAKMCSRLASILTIKDRPNEARDHIDLGWTRRADALPYVVPRLLWFRVLFALEDGGSIAPLLGQLELVLSDESVFTVPSGESVSLSSWSMDSVLEHLQPRRPGDAHALLTALVGAIRDRSNLAALDAFPDRRLRRLPALLVVSRPAVGVGGSGGGSYVDSAHPANASYRPIQLALVLIAHRARGRCRFPTRRPRIDCRHSRAGDPFPSGPVRARLRR